jgi:hypothetical protein
VLTLTVSAQDLKYNDLSKDSVNLKGSYTSYMAKDGTVYFAGDVLQAKITSTANYEKVEIVSFSVVGNKTTGFNVFVKTKTSTINFERALEIGLIKSFEEVQKGNDKPEK